MVAGVFVYPHLFSTQETNVSDLLTRTHPQFSSTDRSPYFSQSLHYPRGRDYSATPISLRRERKLNELLPRRQQFDRAVFQAQSRKMSYHPCPGEVFVKK